MKENLLQEEANTQSLKEKVHNDESSIGMLKRSLNNLEDQITEKKKAKQSAIAEQRFMDAKHFTEEIKQMTDEGEQKQRELSSIEDGLKVSKRDLQNANKILEKLRKDYDYKLKEFDLKIIENLRTINSDIDLFLIKNTETWFKEILELQVSSNEEIIKRLQNNHGLDENEVTNNTSKPDITEDLTKLERKLNEAVENEDFDLAQEISEQIKDLTNDTNS
ncbi:myosin heavy chain, clone 203-like [Clytia hemisphaerica]|uniref:myosin heavy chain, clone 203-like n=1 Tax=Clytia hemisphaerica TaxID=252671 RepID=UPI0034D5655F